MTTGDVLMDDREARMIVGIIAAYWPHQTMPDSTVMAWKSKLYPYAFEDARDAVEELAVSTKWMPAIADVIAMIRAGWANRQAGMLTEGEGPSLTEFIEQNPEWKERVEAFTKKATGRREEKSEPPIDRYEQLRRDAAEIDRPKAKTRHGRNDGHQHWAIENDRCHYCGVRVELA